MILDMLVALISVELPERHYCDARHLRPPGGHLRPDQGAPPSCSMPWPLSSTLAHCSSNYRSSLTLGHSLDAIEASRLASTKKLPSSLRGHRPVFMGWNHGIVGALVFLSRSGRSLDGSVGWYSFCTFCIYRLLKFRYVWTLLSPASIRLSGTIRHAVEDGATDETNKGRQKPMDQTAETLAPLLLGIEKLVLGINISTRPNGESPELINQNCHLPVEIRRLRMRSRSRKT
jgi:hypothetical protein